MNDRIGNEGRNARTLLWMSEEDQEKLASATLLVVGCGGTGSLLAVNAAYVGFRKIVICEADTLELSNLNRFLQATPDDVGRYKAELIREYLATHVSEASVSVILESFPSMAAIAVLQDASAIIAGCVDDTRVRVELDVACRRFGRTLVDLGTGFVSKHGRIMSSGGQVLISRPDGPCLMCLGFTHLLNENNYLVGPDESPQPSLLLLNSVVSSFGAECLMNEVVSEPGSFNSVDYFRSSLSARTTRLPGRQECMICGVASAPHIASVLPDIPDEGGAI